jgi:hypothetical protein
LYGGGDSNSIFTTGIRAPNLRYTLRSDIDLNLDPNVPGRLF